MGLYLFAIANLFVFGLIETAPAQNTDGQGAVVLTLKRPEVVLSAGLAPHFSSFYFRNLHNYGYGIRPNYRSMQFLPLTNVGLEAGAGRISFRYSLLTTFPFAPTYDIFERSGRLLNEATYEEWTQRTGFTITVLQHVTIGLEYHTRGIRFRDYDSDPTVKFEYNLQKQRNLLVTGSGTIVMGDLHVNPTVRYSIRRWAGPGFNFVDRDNPAERGTVDYTLPINGNTDYFSAGMTFGAPSISKNLRFLVRYESFSNSMIENNRWLFGIVYRIDLLIRLLQ